MTTSPFLAALLAGAGLPSGPMMPGALSTSLAAPSSGPGSPLAPQIPLLPNAGRGAIGPQPHLPPGPQPPPGPFSSLLNDPLKLAQLFQIIFPGGSNGRPIGIPGGGMPAGFGSLAGSGAALGPGSLAGVGFFPDSGAGLAGGSAIEDLGPLAFAGLF